MWQTLTSLIFILFSCLDARAEPKKLEVGLSDVGPLAYRENGQLKGINYDIMTQLEKESGLRFNYTLYPHARLIHSIEQTHSDLAVFFAVNCLKYPKTYEVQTRLHKAHLGLYLKSSLTLEKPHLRIGLVRGTCTRLAAQALKPEMIVDVSHMEQAVEMLKAGRLDGVCGVKAVVDFSLNKHQEFKEKLHLVKSDPEPMEAVICRKKNLPEEVKAKLNEAAKKIKPSSLE